MYIKDIFVLNYSWHLIEETYNLLIIYPDILLISILMIIISYLVILDYFFNNKFILNNISKILSFISIILLLVLLLNNYVLTLIGFQSLLISNTYTIFIKMVILVSSVFILLLSIDYLKKEKIVNFEYFILILLVLLGLFMIISSYDLLSLYLAIELQSLCFYILATLKNYTNFSSEAGVKYFILGAFSSGLLLFGFSLLYGFTGLTDFYNLEIFFQQKYSTFILEKGLIISFIFIITGLLFKISAAPFHMWAPDVYEGAPSIVTAFFAIVPKIAILTIFTRLIISILNQQMWELNQFLMISGLTSLFIGIFGALYQVKIKRLLAYSGITHVGFILVSLSILSVESFFSFLFYILVYMILSLNIFSLILSFRKWTSNMKIKKINELVYVFRANKPLSIIFAITLFSLAGIPPLVGFYSKFYVFMAGLQNNFFFIILLIALLSVISSMYYIRLIKLLFFRSYNYCILMCNIPYFNSLLISFTFLFNFFFLFWPNLVIIYLNNLIFTLFL